MVISIPQWKKLTDQVKNLCGYKIFLIDRVYFMKPFWDERYATDYFVYGKEPNSFFASEITKLTPGKILLPGEGEGRNAVYAASKGWKVDAFDQSKVGFEKAFSFARELGVTIDYQVSELDRFDFKQNYYDTVGLIFFHALPAERKMLHTKVRNALKIGGTVILEAFHTLQLGNGTGGPQSQKMLFDREIILDDFPDLQPLFIEELIMTLNEGPFHQGKANIIRFVGKKLM